MRYPFVSFWLNWLLVAGLVVLTYNPRGTSYYHWLAGAAAVGHWQVLTGCALSLAWLVVIRAAWLGLRTAGLLAATLALAGVTWVAADASRLDLADRRIVTWVGLLILATALAVGMTWSRVRPAGTKRNDQFR